MVYFSTTTLPGTFAFTFSATKMIEVSLSQTQSEPPNKQVFFTTSATEFARWSVAAAVCRSHATGTRVDDCQTCPQIVVDSSPSSARGCLTAKSTEMMGLSSRSNGLTSDVQCFHATSEYARAAIQDVRRSSAGVRAQMGLVIGARLGQKYGLPEVVLGDGRRAELPAIGPFTQLCEICWEWTNSDFQFGPGWAANETLLVQYC